MHLLKDCLTFSSDNSLLRVQFNEKGEPLFCLTDVCKALELVCPTNVVTAIREEFFPEELSLKSKDSLITILIDTGYGIKPLVFLTEPQLYFVIMRSRVAKARTFRQWVLNDVLPTIRKTGSYSLITKNSIDKKLEFLKKCLDSGNLTKEEHMEFLKKLGEEYIATRA